MTSAVSTRKAHNYSRHLEAGFRYFISITLAVLFILMAPSLCSAVTVDTYTAQDWKKLQAAVDALKSPVQRDDIELEPSAIGQFLHTDYVRSLSTPNIHELQLDTSVSETNIQSAPPLSSVSHSSTFHSFPNYALVGPAAATDQMPRRTRVPSSRSIRRQRITSMAEAGDKFEAGGASNQATRPESSVCSLQGSPMISRSSTGAPFTASPEKAESTARAPSQESGAAKKKKKKRGDKSFEQSEGAASGGGASAARLAKNLHQGAIVYEGGEYRKARLG